MFSKIRLRAKDDLFSLSEGEKSQSGYCKAALLSSAGIALGASILAYNNWKSVMPNAHQDQWELTDFGVKEMPQVIEMLRTKKEAQNNEFLSLLSQGSPLCTWNIARLLTPSSGMDEFFRSKWGLEPYDHGTFPADQSSLFWENALPPPEWRADDVIHGYSQYVKSWKRP